MAVILVLEDFPERVYWLAEFTGGTIMPTNPCAPVEHEIFWSTTVKQFLVDLDNIIPDLILLDHDLGSLRHTKSFEKDEDGLSGLDAARMMPEVSCPILVWSWNPYGAQQMVLTLRGRGMEAEYAPFGDGWLGARIGDILPENTSPDGTPPGNPGDAPDGHQPGNE